MSNEILLKTLRDALRRLEAKKEEVEGRIKAYEKTQQWKHERVQDAERHRQHAEEQNRTTTKEMDVLRTFMSGQREQSRALIEQFDVLQQQQLRILSAVKSATDHADNMRANLRDAERQLAGAEQDRASAQREWDEIAEQVTHISSSSLQ